MILGIGNDLTLIERVATVYKRHSTRFLQRVFTPLEQDRALAKPHVERTLAKRFAAKEACAKALGTGFSRGVYLKDIGVVNLPTGQPTIQLTGGAALRLKQLCPDGYQPRIHLTLTDDPPYAQAFVIIEAVRED